jgi:hypothetical protein
VGGRGRRRRRGRTAARPAGHDDLRDGLSAKLTGVVEALHEPLLPFFITRDEDIRDPGELGEAGGITWVELSGDAARLDEWLGGAQLPVRVVEGEPGVRAVGIGERELR